jgi:hypothetical protein
MVSFFLIKMTSIKNAVMFAVTIEGAKSGSVNPTLDQMQIAARF